MNNGTEMFLETRHGQLTGLAFGDPTGRPVLALHGWQDNGASFSRLAPMLEGVNLVAIDLPGHGKSTWKATGASYLFADWVVDGYEIANALEWETFDLLGHSMGAGIASLMAGTAPERISRLALIEGLGPLSTPAHETPDTLRKGVDALARPMLSIRGSSSIEEAIERRMTPQALITRESAEVLLSRGLVEQEGVYQFRHDPRLKYPSSLRFTEEQVLEFLGRITAPTMLLKADRGWPFDKAIFTKRVEAVAHCEVVEVKGGHHVHLDAPLQVLQHIQRFLG